eukprot:gnl/MRDRNA2_/MRDRNA2_26639_c0_seq1.p1 gnl/MRDRNA2_/MRDRNA2_26639_c0~~gnl/MRDRNA2_/MRDRNA2_26639_c0_seq1.p1  ORF type:complete len:547 (-),score=65.41 gnl/MRDRNA2_/MRDRNA2_26639_c0_seq1:130-1551(-)
MLHPCIGRTDTWTVGVINRDWSVRQYDSKCSESWPEIVWSHQLWYSRRGVRLDASNISQMTQKVRPEQIRRIGEVLERPVLTLFHVRWGGPEPVDPVVDGAGGWGQIGSTPSDNYINAWEDHVFSRLGPTYDIISAFIQGSEDMGKINPPLLRQLMKGAHLNACYFLWPVLFQDGTNDPAYVHNHRLLELMVIMEGTGISTRFPHPSHLYRLYASKEWTSQMCLHPLLKVPLTTMVSRSAVASNAERAASGALAALNSLAETRSAWAAPLGQEPIETARILKGVAKLGWSWQAMDVVIWRNKTELQHALTDLLEQPGSYAEQCFVQEWFDFDVEMRHFIVEPDLSQPESLLPKAVMYTTFKSDKEQYLKDFDRFDRATCLKRYFNNDRAGLADAESQSLVLINRWLRWMQAQTHELPVVTRFDVLVKHLGPGRAVVRMGELTELGACFLGWPEGPQEVFGAMLRSCFREHALM